MNVETPAFWATDVTKEEPEKQIQSVSDDCLFHYHERFSQIGLPLRVTIFKSCVKAKKKKNLERVGKRAGKVSLLTAWPKQCENSRGVVEYDVESFELVAISIVSTIEVLT